MAESSIITSVSGPVATIWLNRPEKHNALDGDMISGLLAAIKNINEMRDVRVIVLRGKGRSFCSGADLNWMRDSWDLTDYENLHECEELAACFYSLYQCRFVTICLIHGSSLGGANGLVSACDIAVSNDETTFGFPEVRSGIFPATVAPYIIYRTGNSRAFELMLTGRSFTAEEALQLGLVHHVVSAERTEGFLELLISEILKGSPAVQKQIKEMHANMVKLSADQSVIYKTALMLAQSRTSADAREGLNAFKQKRSPEWYRELK